MGAAEQDLAIACRCGTFRGKVRRASPDAGTHIICYCDDCQAYARFLGREDILDEWGGTQIMQLPPGRLELDEGSEHVASAQLKPGGMIRFYASCCKTPIGNTVSAGVPFVGLFFEMFEDADQAARAIGPVLFRYQCRFARGDGPQGGLPTLPLRWWLRHGPKMLRAKLSRREARGPLYTEDGRPIAEPALIETTKSTEA